jgi:hypothetical protein
MEDDLGSLSVSLSYKGRKGAFPDIDALVIAVPNVTLPKESDGAMVCSWKELFHTWQFLLTLFVGEFALLTPEVHASGVFVEGTLRHVAHRSSLAHYSAGYCQHLEQGLCIQVSPAAHAGVCLHWCVHLSASVCICLCVCVSVRSVCMCVCIPAFLLLPASPLGTCLYTRHVAGQHMSPDTPVCSHGAVSVAVL